VNRSDGSEAFCTPISKLGAFGHISTNLQPLYSAFALKDDRMPPMPDQSESSKAKQDETYEAPKIEWEEVLEEAGVYAACAKEIGSTNLACQGSPRDPSAS
jgi:hypothetical protein